MKYRLGIDVGGTNTDAVIINEDQNIVESIKTPTTEDVSSGIYNALRKVLKKSNIDKDNIYCATLGTTHCTNAIVERKRLNRVGVIRIGKPATVSILPMLDWPEDLKNELGRESYVVKGGFEFNGQEITSFDSEEVRKVLKSIKGKVDSIAVISVFSPISPEHEEMTAEIVKEEMGNIPLSLSHEISSIGLLERENATILNAALAKVAKITANAFKESLKKEGVSEAEVYLCQNDGTIMDIEYAKKYPILTIACGPTNSIRGAAFMSGIDNGLVLDLGGTTSDVGFIMNNFPRESSIAVEIGGVRTNFRMPDLVSIGLGGGTIIKKENGEIKIGPESVGYRLIDEAMVFGGDTLTATDIAVRLGMADIGESKWVNDIEENFARRCMEKMMGMVNKIIDKMKLSGEPITLVIVGGGSILIDIDKLEGVSEVIHPDNYEVANAFGASIAQISAQIEKLYSFEKMERDEVLLDAKNRAKKEAMKAGADPDTLKIVEVEDVPLAYLPGNVTRVKVKAVGDLN